MDPGTRRLPLRSWALGLSEPRQEAQWGKGPVPSRVGTCVCVCARVHTRVSPQRAARETWALTPRQAAPRPAVAPLATIRLHLQDRFLTGMLCQNVLGTCAWPLSLCSGRRDRGLLSCAGDGRLGLSFQGTPQWVWLCLGFTLCVCDVWAPCFSDATCAPGPVGERVPWPTQQETGRDVDVCFLVSLLDFLSIRLRAGQDRQVRAGSD